MAEPARPGAAGDDVIAGQRDSTHSEPSLGRAAASGVPLPWALHPVPDRSTPIFIIYPQYNAGHLTSISRLSATPSGAASNSTSVHRSVAPRGTAARTVQPASLVTSIIRSGLLGSAMGVDNKPPLGAKLLADELTAGVQAAEHQQQRLVLQQQMDHESLFFSNLLSFTEARSTMDNLFVKNCPERRIEEEKPIKTKLVQPGNWKPDSPGEYYRSPSALKELVAFFLSESSLPPLSPFSASARFVASKA